MLFRSQKHDERILLAGKVTEIKTLYGEAVRVIDELLEKYNDLENLLSEAFPPEESDEGFGIIESTGKNRAGLENLRTKANGMYDKLGYEALRTTDPVVLSAVAVESDGIKKELEKEKILVENMMRKVETIIENKSKQSANTKVRRKKPLKKQVAKGRKI